MENQARTVYLQKNDPQSDSAILQAMEAQGYHVVEQSDAAFKLRFCPVPVKYRPRVCRRFTDGM